MLLEKAYAKVHGSYYLLKGGFVHEALYDLTGCPTSCYNMKDEYVKHFIKNGQFWELIKYFQNEGYLMAFTTPGEERWSKQNPKINGVKQKDGRGVRKDEPPLPLAQGFAVVDVKDLGKEGRIICLRAPLDKYPWNGEWSKSSSKYKIIENLLMQGDLQTPNIATGSIESNSRGFLATDGSYPNSPDPTKR